MRVVNIISSLLLIALGCLMLRISSFPSHPAWTTLVAYVAIVIGIVFLIIALMKFRRT